MRTSFKFLLALSTVLLLVLISYLLFPTTWHRFIQLIFPWEQQNSGLPGPLRGPNDRPGQEITIAGTLAETNRYRQIAGQSPLRLHPALNQVAEKKLEDMFTNQYFEHVSPAGIGPGALVDQTNYHYLRIGENLALGNFAGDTQLVKSWMDSPGHRANILSGGFSEIGIATGFGQFEGESTWLAVQTFSLPEDACPAPQKNLQQSFNNQQAYLNQQSSQLNQEKSALNKRQKQIDALLAQSVQLTQSGNDNITRGNAIIKDGQDPLDPDSPVSSDTLYTRGRQLQQTGQEQLQQASTISQSADQLNQEQAKQLDDYNAKVPSFNQLNTELSSLAGQINEQVRAFNACIDKYGQ